MAERWARGSAGGWPDAPARSARLVALFEGRGISSDGSAPAEPRGAQVCATWPETRRKAPTQQRVGAFCWVGYARSRS